MNLLTVYKFVWGASAILLLVNSRTLRSNDVDTTLRQLPEEEVDISGQEGNNKYKKNDLKDFLKQGESCTSDVLLLVAVCSAISHFQQREAIRSTWGSYPGMEVKVVFLVGLPAPNDTVPDVLRDLEEESNRHKDIVQVPVVDSYANLTLKSVAMLKWTSIQCAHVPFVLKTDDDMYINIPVLLGDLRHSLHKRFLLGHLIAGARPIRDKTSKYFVPKSIYSDRMYPKYLSGTAYVISGDLITDLIQAANETERFVFEDVYLTGIIAKSVGAQHIHNGRFGYHARTPDPCLYKIIITAHHMTPSSLKNMWRLLSRDDLRCPYTRINVQD